MRNYVQPAPRANGDSEQKPHARTSSCWWGSIGCPRRHSHLIPAVVGPRFCEPEISGSCLFPDVRWRPGIFQLWSAPACGASRVSRSRKNNIQSAQKGHVIIGSNTFCSAPRHVLIIMMLIAVISEADKMNRRGLECKRDSDNCITIGMR